MRWLASVAVLAAGCASFSGRYLGNGAAPKVPAPRAVALQIDLAGDERDTVDEALAWLLRENGLLRRVPSGGEAHVTIETHVHEERALLAGSQLTVEVRVRGDGLDEQHRFVADGIISGVPTELEKLTTDGLAWALGRAAATAAAPPPPPPPPTTTTAAMSVPESVPDPPPPVPSRPKKKHRRR